MSNYVGWKARLLKSVRRPTPPASTGLPLPPPEPRLSLAKLPSLRFKSSSSRTQQQKYPLNARYLEALPNEIILELIDALESPSLINAFSQTCKRFHELTEPILYRQLVESQTLYDLARGFERLACLGPAENRAWSLKVNQNVSFRKYKNHVRGAKFGFEDCFEGCQQQRPTCSQVISRQGKSIEIYMKGYLCSVMGNFEHLTSVHLEWIPCLDLDHPIRLIRNLVTTKPCLTDLMIAVLLIHPFVNPEQPSIEKWSATASEGVPVCRLQRFAIHIKPLEWSDKQTAVDPIPYVSLPLTQCFNSIQVLEVMVYNKLRRNIELAPSITRWEMPNLVSLSLIYGSNRPNLTFHSTETLSGVRELHVLLKNMMSPVIEEGVKRAEEIIPQLLPFVNMERIFIYQRICYPSDKELEAAVRATWAEVASKFARRLVHLQSVHIRNGGNTPDPFLKSKTRLTLHRPFDLKSDDLVDM